MTPSVFFDFLIKIKGIGPWSIEMSRIFYVGDLDVFSILDLGLKNAHLKMFDINSYNEDFYMEFSPYRSYMCLYMWRVLEDENVTI
jgi:DNA-3-methyladenine glycosylase II